MSLLPMTMIIPTYERADSLVSTLKSMLSCVDKPEEVIIIDQSVDDELISYKINEINEKYEGTMRYRHIELPSSTMARNCGIELANNNILVFSDDDVNYDENIFRNVYKFLSQNEYALVAGLDRLAVRQCGIFSYIFGLRNFLKRKKGHISLGVFGRYPNVEDVDCETSTEWAMGYFFCCKKKIIMEHNIFFDEQMGQYAYSEDLDFSVRYCNEARMNQMKCIITPDVIVEHCNQRGWRIASKSKTYRLVFNRYYILKKAITAEFTAFGFWWANFGILIKKIIKRDNVRDYFEALYNCYKYREDIRNGNFHAELYD